MARFDIEEYDIPDLANMTGSTGGMRIVGHYYIVRKGDKPLKGFPLLITGSQALAEFFAVEMNRLGKEEIERRWARGDFRRALEASASERGDSEQDRTRLVAVR